jgi:hypothetical protein
MSRRTPASVARTRPLALAALLALALAACGDRPGPIKIHSPWARLQPPASRMTGAFMVLENQGRQADALVGASCDCAQTVELHVMADVDGRMSMRRTERFDLAPGQRFALAPGGPHLMLIGLTAPLKADQPVRMRLRFEKAGELELEVPLRDPRSGR